MDWQELNRVKLRNNSKYVKGLLWGSGCALAMLWTSPTYLGIVGFAVAITILIPGTRYLYSAWETRGIEFNWVCVPVCILLVINNIGVFQSQWKYSGIAMRIMELLGKNAGGNILIVNVILNLLSVPFTLLVLEWAVDQVGNHAELVPTLPCEGDRQVLLSTRIWLLVTSFCIITLVSKCSPLYPLNDWGDANVYFTMGKGIACGLVPYRDLYDHKGPIIYFLHALAYYVNNTGFIGIWFVEIVTCYGFLYYAYKTMRMYLRNDTEILILIIPLLCSVVYSAKAFCEGDSAEEFCLPMLMYAMYCGLCSVRGCKSGGWFSTGVKIGLIGGIIFWTKYTILGFFVGWAMVELYIAWRDERWRGMCNLSFGVLAGIVTVTIPIFVYFFYHGALKDLFEVYFYDNIFCYSSANGLISVVLNLKDGFIQFVWDNSAVYVLICLGFLAVYLKKISILESSYLGIPFCSMCFLTFFGRSFNYYSLIFAIYAIGGCVFLVEVLKTVKSEIKMESVSLPPTIRKCLPLAVLTLAVGFSLATSNNSGSLLKRKESLPQYQFAQIIRQSEEPTLLNYGGLDKGFYTAANLLPNVKYFFSPNLNKDEMISERNRYIEDAVAEFVVTIGRELDSPTYELISQAEQYYLYRRCCQG